MATKAKPVCRYGKGCYRKNVDHLRKFDHPDPESDDKTASSLDQSSSSTENNDELSVERDRKRASSSPVKQSADDKTTSPSPSPKRRKLNKEKSEATNPADFIKEKFLVSMPPDFFDAWKLAESLSSENPSDAFKSEHDGQLVGAFDVLAGRFESNETELTDDDYLLHWRFAIDLPELQTVLVYKGGHYGYWRFVGQCASFELYSDMAHTDILTNRPMNCLFDHLSRSNTMDCIFFSDSPEESPIVVHVADDSDDFPKFTVVGDNLFAALIHLLTREKGAKNKELIEKVEKAAAKGKYDVQKTTERTRARNKRVVASTLHNVGIVVTVVKDVGYRTLSETNVVLKKILDIIRTTDDEDLKSSKLDNLQEMVTYVQFANDEADFGMGLELGHDLFYANIPTVDNAAAQLLSVAYSLLKRTQFGSILKAHMPHRRRSNLSVLPDE